MKFKQNKKKVMIFIVGLLIIILAFGTFKGYQSFCNDQRQTEADMDSMMQLFNMQLRVPDDEKPDRWLYVQYMAPEDKTFNIGSFMHYLFKKVTLQKIEYKDVEPQWSLLPTQANPKLPNDLSTIECLKNFNDNLLYNPEYEQYRSDLNFNQPLTMDDLLSNPQKVTKLIYRLFNYAGGDGWSFDDLADNPCPAQYLPK